MRKISHFHGVHIRCRWSTVRTKVSEWKFEAVMKDGICRGLSNILLNSMSSCTSAYLLASSVNCRNLMSILLRPHAIWLEFYLRIPKGWMKHSEGIPQVNMLMINIFECLSKNIIVIIFRFFFIHRSIDYYLIPAYPNSIKHHLESYRIYASKCIILSSDFGVN